MSLMPEASHMITWILSDRTIPRSYRTMQGFGVHTFALINEAGQRTFAKFHWRPIAGTHSLVWDEAQKIAGADPDFHRRDVRYISIIECNIECTINLFHLTHFYIFGC